MNTNTQFAVALHILAMLAYQREETLTSEWIARSVVTNPVVIRRILGLLRTADMVKSQNGFKGGWKLARAPESLTLLEVYRALKPPTLFPLPQSSPNADCIIGCHVGDALTEVFAEISEAMESRLATMTLAQVLARIMCGERR